jgi:hypothetical protein
VRSLVDTPGQTASNWAIGLANTDIDDSITNGVTGRAPSQNAVFDALAQKVDLNSTQAFTPGFTGFSANPTVVARYVVIGKRCFISIFTSSAGTSNATTFTITGLPVASANTSIDYYGSGFGVDNGSATITTIILPPNSTTISLYKGTANGGSTWTGSGQKYVNFQFSYEIA